MPIAPPASHTLSPPNDPVASISPASEPASGSSGVNALNGGLNSTEILRGKKAVEINHNGSTYRLQATRLGKLILTK